MKPIKIIKSLVEAVDMNDDNIHIYMNTWKNYNEYGADLSQYGINSISDGWLTVDEAIEFCEKYADDEPFINDYENSPIDLPENGAPATLEGLKKYEDSDYKDEAKAILQSGYTNDIGEAIDKAESGDYIYLPGATDNKSLAEAYIDMVGGITAAVSKDRLAEFFDEEGYKEEIEDDVRDMIAKDNNYDSIDDVTDEELQSYLDAIVEDEISTASYDGRDDFFEAHFDYEAFGDELSYNFDFVDDGAIQVL